jgi:HEAT repeat protein
VRILATELARNMPAQDATRVLCGLIEHEQHPNVCAAAIDVLAEVGTRDAIPALTACAERFSNTPFVPFAVSITMARISDAEG